MPASSASFASRLFLRVLTVVANVRIAFLFSEMPLAFVATSAFSVSIAASRDASSVPMSVPAGIVPRILFMFSIASVSALASALLLIRVVSSLTAVLSSAFVA